jgi:hypothetical protein
LPQPIVQIRAVTRDDHEDPGHKER